jgi:serine/threonine protein kinase
MLVNEVWVVKISDLGTVRVLSDSGFEQAREVELNDMGDTERRPLLTSYRGTLEYQAPEVLDDKKCVFVCVCVFYKNDTFY